jgi:hypothetical protein
MQSYGLRAASVPLLIAALFAAGCAGSNSPGSEFQLAPSSATAPLAKHSQSKLYVTNYNGGVLVYSTGSSPQLLQTINDGVPRPYGAWVDKSGILYVVNLADNSGGPTLSEFKPGATAPFLQITNNIPYFGVVAVDAKKNLYVSGLLESYKSSYVEVFTPGKTLPSQTLEIPTQGTESRSESLTFDQNGNLLVGIAALPKRYTSVLRLNGSSGQFTSLGLHSVLGGLATADAAGDLFTGGDNRKISVFAPGATKPTRTISIPGYKLIVALAAAADGTLYVAASPYVYVYAPGAHKPSTTINTNAGIGGLAVSQ